MKIFRSNLNLLVITILMLSCKDEKTEELADPNVLVVGRWNSYEIGSTSSGFVPGQETLITLAYASGMRFYADHRFAMRLYNSSNTTWEDGTIIGTYEFVNDQTIELVFSPKTKDESKLQVKIDKLNKDVFWVQHRYWVNDQNPNPTEYHLQRVK